MEVALSSSTTRSFNMRFPNLRLLEARTTSNHFLLSFGESVLRTEQYYKPQVLNCLNDRQRRCRLDCIFYFGGLTDAFSLPQVLLSLHSSVDLIECLLSSSLLQISATLYNNKYLERERKEVDSRFL